jgi:hypothetical protein
MTTTLEPTSPALAAAAAHHASLRARLTELTEAFIGAVAAGSPAAAPRGELVTFLRTQLLPHAEVEDQLLYTAVRTDRTALLTRAMQDEHRMIAALVDEVQRAATPMDAAVAAGALVVLCEVRIEQEDNHLLPTLEAAGLDMANLLGDHAEIVGTSAGRPA